MDLNGKFDSRYVEISELTSKISSITRKTFDDGRNELSASDIEHILKITSDVTGKIRPLLKEITV